MSPTEYEITNENILEIRYKPNPKILDYRGTWAEILAQVMNVSEWRIDENRIDVSNKEKTLKAFASYKNAGAVIWNSTTRNYFSDQANKMLRFLFGQKSFGDPIFVSRLGVRSRYAIPFDGTFKELVTRLSSRFFTLSEEAQNIFGDAVIYDLAIPLDFEAKSGNIKASIGPMGSDQISKVFELITDPPNVALYIDLDFWKRPQKEISGREIINTVKSFSSDVWDLREKIQLLLFD